jgi:hypothetical protein
MFDLEYYNEITDYGKLIEIITERRRTLYETQMKPPNKTKINKQRDIWFYQLEQFNTKHIGYSNWFNNNKVIKKLYTDEYLNNIDNRLNKL